MTTSPFSSPFVKAMNETLLMTAISRAYFMSFKIDEERMRLQPGFWMVHGDEYPDTIRVLAAGPEWVRMEISYRGAVEFALTRLAGDFHAIFGGKEIEVDGNAKYFCGLMLDKFAEMAEELKAGAAWTTLRLDNYEDRLPDTPPSDRDLRLARLYLARNKYAGQEVQNLRYLVEREQQLRKELRP